MLDTTQPVFQTSEDDAEYVERVNAAVAAGQMPPGPGNVIQIHIVCDICPEYAHLWRPSDSDRKAMGLPECLGREASPFSEDWRERHLATVEADDDYRLSLAFMLRGGAR